MSQRFRTFRQVFFLGFLVFFPVFLMGQQESERSHKEHGHVSASLIILPAAHSLFLFHFCLSVAASADAEEEHADTCEKENSCVCPETPVQEKSYLGRECPEQTQMSLGVPPAWWGPAHLTPAQPLPGP